MRARIRTIKPDIWEDEDVGDLSYAARLLFIGLITMADDEGRLREIPSSIIGRVFPHDTVTARRLCKWLEEVEHAGMIIRYVVDGRRYILFPHWTDHQKIDRPSPSIFPEPSANDRREGDEASHHARGRASQSLPNPNPSGNDSRSQDQIDRAIFDDWREQCGHPDAKPTKERLSKIRARRNEGYTEEQIREGIRGAACAAFVNDAGRRFDDIELICRSGSKLDSFIARTDGTTANELDRKRLASLRSLQAERGIA